MHRYIEGFKPYHTDVKPNTWVAVQKEFETDLSEPTHYVAIYETGNYEGNAIVITTEDGETFNFCSAGH